jgi:NADH-quinone oxidoreductase subunit L
MENPLNVSFVHWIIVLPLIGAAINFLLGSRIQRAFGKGAIGAIGCGVVLGAFAIAVSGFIRMLGLEPEHRFMLDDLWLWLNIGGLKLDIAFWLDPLSMVMTLIITGVGGVIHIYSTGYMHDEESFWRFFGWLNLFIFFMLILVLGDNLWLMFVGWEGVGLCSFALIGFWHKVLANTHAGNKAFIVNRVGDWAFVIALYSLFWGLSAVGHPTLVTREIAQWSPLLAGKPGYLGLSLVSFITLLMFIGATGKSAQIPLYVWLPDAMAGPTPVSALIHAATMVTAGIYMVARLNFLFSMAPDTMLVIATVGALTAFFAATIGTAQNDIKRVLAYSTVSQLGYMFTAVGVGAYAAGVFHLMTHAFFKASLFMSAGSLISAMGGEQSLDRMSGWRKALPFTFACFVLGGLALSGFPPFSGWLSKDDIIGYLDYRGGGFEILGILGYVGALLTGLYTFRMIFRAFYGDPCPEAVELEHGHMAHAEIPTNPLTGEEEDTDVGFPGPEHVIAEQEWPMKIAMGLLAVLATVGGLVQIPGVDHVIESFLQPALAGSALAAPAAQPSTGAAWIGLAIGAVIGVIGIGIAYRVWVARPGTAARLQQMFAPVYTLLSDKWYFDELIDVVVVRPALMLGRLSESVLERIVISGGVTGGVTGLVRAGSAAVRRAQTGFLRYYAAALILGLALLTVYFLVSSN